MTRRNDWGTLILNMKISFKCTLADRRINQLNADCGKPRLKWDNRCGCSKLVSCTRSIKYTANLFFQLLCGDKHYRCLDYVHRQHVFKMWDAQEGGQCGRLVSRVEDFDNRVVSFNNKSTLVMMSEKLLSRLKFNKLSVSFPFFFLDLDLNQAVSGPRHNHKKFQ